MSLLLQLNADLPEHFLHDQRRLHIFTCRKKQCSRNLGSIRALRETRKLEKAGVTHGNEEGVLPRAESQVQPEDLGATLFGTTSTKFSTSNANPFSTCSQRSSPPSNPFKPQAPTSTLAAKSPQRPQEPPTETFASKLRISSPPPAPKLEAPTEPWPPESAFLAPFPYLHLDGDYEGLTLEKPQVPEASSSKTQPQYAEEDANGVNSLDKDSFESSLDKTFLKFSDRLAQNPEQVLRYEWKGTPLLYCSTDAVGRRLAALNAKVKTGAGMPGCESCGAERVFELQLVPGAIAALEGENVNVEEGMEWGTIIVGVCARNCGEVGNVVFREEWCGVQWEETE